MEVNNKNILSAQDNIQLVATQKVMSAEEFTKKYGKRKHQSI